MKKYLLVIAVAVTFIGCKPAQKITPVEATNKLGPNPHFIIDGQASDKSAMPTMDAEDVASLTAYYGKDATRRYGTKPKTEQLKLNQKHMLKRSTRRY
jgi:hypothetical protein